MDKQKAHIMDKSNEKNIHRIHYHGAPVEQNGTTRIMCPSYSTYYQLLISYFEDKMLILSIKKRTSEVRVPGSNASPHHFLGTLNRVPPSSEHERPMNPDRSVRGALGRKRWVTDPHCVGRNGSPFGFPGSAAPNCLDGPTNGIPSAQAFEWNVAVITDGLHGHPARTTNGSVRSNPLKGEEVRRVGSPAMQAS